MKITIAARHWFFVLALGLLATLGFSQTVRAPQPEPARPYLLRAVVPIDGDYSGPIRLDGLATESSVVGKDRFQTYHLIAAWITKAGPYKVLREAAPASKIRISDETLSAGLTPGLVSLVIDGHRFSLTGDAPRVEHFGRLFAQCRRNIDLGEYGAAQLWMQARADTKQLDMILNWHAGADRQGDAIFSSATISVPSGVKWQASLPDPAVGDGFLVKPILGGGKHILPQRGERSFRFSVTPDAAFKPTQYGLADTLYGWTIPKLNVSVSDIGSWREELRTNKPSSDITGGAPVSWFWPACGSQYGGVTGGVDMTPYVGVGWFVSCSRDGFDRYAIEQLRYRSRHWGCLYEKDGDPVAWWTHLSSSGSAEWRMFDSIWESSGGQPIDGPFGPWPARRFADAAYIPQSSSGVDNFYKSQDCQHAIREWNHNALLVATTQDPLALLYMRMEAAKAVMTFWPWAGRAQRMPGVLPDGGGTSFGRANAWALMVVSESITWGISAEHYMPFVKAQVDHLVAAQMANGLFQLNPVAKEAKSWPFDENGDNQSNEYVVGSGNEECYIAASIREANRVFEVPSSVLQRHESGMLGLAWCRGGVWSHAARRRVGGPLYMTQADWPETLRTALRSSPRPDGVGPYDDSWHIGYWLACTHSQQGLLRYTGRTTVADAIASLVVRTRDCDQWWPVLGVAWPTN